MNSKIFGFSSQNSIVMTVLGLLICTLTIFISFFDVKFAVIFLALILIVVISVYLFKIATRIPLMKFMTFLLVISAFFGSAFFSYHVGFLEVFPFRGIVIIAIALFIIEVIKNNGVISLIHIKVKNYLLFFLIWILYATFSLLWSYFFQDAVKNILYLTTELALVFFVIYYLKKLDDYKSIYYFWLILLPILVVIGIWEKNTGLHLSVSGLNDTPSHLAHFRFMPTAIFYNGNDFALFLTLSIGFLVSFIKNHKNKFTKFFGSFVLAATLYVFFYTQSRLCVLGIAMGLLFWMLFLLKIKEKIKLVFIALIIGMCLIVPFQSQFSNAFKILDNQNYSFHSDSFYEDESYLSRFNIIRNSLLLLEKYYGFGVGAGNIESNLENFPVYNTYGNTSVHNWWIELLANYGILIFIGYAMFYFSLFYSLYRVHRKLEDRIEKMICEGLLIGLVSFVLGSNSPSSIMTKGFHWIFYALCVGFLNYFRLKESNKKINEA